MVNTTQYFNQSGFTGAVLPQKCMYFSGLSLQAYILKGLDAREGFMDSFHFK